MDDAGVLNDCTEIGEDGLSIPGPPQPPGAVQEAPGAGLRPPHLRQAGRGGIFPCPVGAGSEDVTFSAPVDKLCELCELLRTEGNFLFKTPRDPSPSPPQKSE